MHGPGGAYGSGDPEGLGLGWELLDRLSISLSPPDRCCLHHNRDLLVESVSHHCGQLPSTLRAQILEAEAVPSQLLQAVLLNMT